MSRGVVLWPDAETSARIVDLWQALEDDGVPSLRSHTHRRHRPHVSLIVGEDLDVEAARAALGPTPRSPIPLRIEAVGLFPEGVLHLPCVANAALLAEHRRVAEAAAPFVSGRWPYFEPDGWAAHLTLAYGLTDDHVARAVRTVAAHLPMVGWLTEAGIEDGTTGDAWPLTAGTGG